MFDLFSDIFAFRDNPLKRIDPRVKVVVTCICIGAVVLSSQLALPLALFGLALLVILALRIPLRLVLIRLAGPMGIAAVILILKSFMGGTHPLFVISVAGRKIIATHEGFWEGVLIGSRVLGAVSVMMLMSFVTPTHQIFHALYWLKVPSEWVEIAIFMYRYTFLFIEQSTDIGMAQKVRLGYSNLRRSLSSLGVLAGTMIIRSMEQSQRTHEAMVARCYSGSMPFGPMPGMKPADWWIMGLAPLMIISTYIIIEWGVL